MTMAMRQLSLGEDVEMKGPLGSFVWKGKGTASWRGVTRNVNELGMVCGGSGEYMTGNPK